MKPVIRKLKNLRGRITGYRASLSGRIDADGATSKEAEANLREKLDGALERLSVGTTIGQFRGHTWVVWPTIEGWRYWTDVFSSPQYSVEQGGLRHDAIDSAIRHLATILWTFEDDDADFVAGLPPSLRDDLLSYFQWQRGYKRLREAGHSDLVAREILGGLRRESESVAV